MNDDPARPPAGDASVPLLDALLLSILVILFATGPLLMFHYEPGIPQAHESLQRLSEEVPFGALLRGIHRLGAQALVAISVLRLVAAFAARDYGGERRRAWDSGLALLLLALAQAAAAHPLPGEADGWWGTVVGLGVARRVPGGSIAAAILQGGPSLSGGSLRRFLAAHAAVLPWPLAAAGLWHLRSMRRRHPLGGAFLGTLLALTVLAAVLPPPAALPADPRAPAPPEARAPWFFAGAQELVRHVPPVLGGAVVPALVLLFLAAVPRLDPGEPGSPRARRGVSLAFSLLAALAAAFTAIGNLR